jgi:myo-inositol-1(or 4)-monophosphatase
MVGVDSAAPAELERFAVELALGGAELIRARVAVGPQGGPEVSAKSTATDLVTETDTGVERWLIDQIRTARADDAVLGEEGGERPGGSGVRWLVDPVDGTVNFVLGLPQFAVSVAAESDGQVVAAAVCNPISGELFHAHRGGGAWLGDVRLSGPRDVPLDRAVVGTGFGYERSLRRRQAAVVAILLGRVGDIRRLGAASLDLCAVAAGRLDAYFEAGLNEWDYAAGGLIAAEAGCVLTGPHGQAPSTRLVAVAGATRAEEFFALLAELEADRVSSPSGS